MLQICSSTHGHEFTILYNIFLTQPYLKMEKINIREDSKRKVIK